MPSTDNVRVTNVRVTATTHVANEANRVTRRTQVAHVSNITRIIGSRPVLIAPTAAPVLIRPSSADPYMVSFLWKLPHDLYITTHRRMYGNEDVTRVLQVHSTEVHDIIHSREHVEVSSLQEGVNYSYNLLNLDLSRNLFPCRVCKALVSSLAVEQVCKSCMDNTDTAACSVCEDMFTMVNDSYVDTMFGGKRLLIPMSHHNCEATVCVECGTSKWAGWEEDETGITQGRGSVVARYVRTSRSNPIPRWIEDRLSLCICTDCYDRMVTSPVKCCACSDDLRSEYGLETTLNIVSSSDGTRYMCYDCDRRLAEKHLIFSYSYKPEPIFRLPNKISYKNINNSTDLFIGMELEVELKRTADRGVFTSYVSELLNKEATVPFAYVKSDGSLRYGVEIVTDPGDLKWWENDFPMHLFTHRGKIENPTLLSIRNTARSAGMHLHLSKSAFNNNSMYNFIMFHKYMRPTIIGMAGRQPNNYCRYTMDTWGRTVIRNYAYGDINNNRIANDRYVGLNLSPRHTVELRYFKSKADEKFLRESVEFAHSMWNFSRVIPDSVWGVDSSTLIPIEEVRNEAGNLYKEFVLSNSDMYPVLSEVLPSVILT